MRPDLGLFSACQRRKVKEHYPPWKSRISGISRALSSVVEHYLHTKQVKFGSTQQIRGDAESKDNRPDFCPDLLRRKRSGRRFVRVATGLYRYSGTGQLYACRKVNGRNSWRTLNTTDKKRAVMLLSLENYAAKANGNCEIRTISVGGEGPVQFELSPEQCPPPETISAHRLTVPAQTLTVPAAQAEAITKPAKITTLRELADEAEAQSQHLSASTLRIRKHYRKVLEKHLDFGMDVTKLTTAQIRRMRAELSAGRKASSVNDLLSKGLKPIITAALESGALEKSPLEAVKPLKKAGTIRLQPTWSEAQAIIDRVEKSAPASAVLLRLMLFFGIGQAEVQGLRGEHVDFGRGVLRLLRQKTKKPYDVPLFDNGGRALLQSLRDQSKIMTGRPVVSWHNPRKALTTASVEMGFPSYSPRSLRRTFIINCLEKGIDPRMVAKWQGHADAKLILGTYGNFIGAEYEAQQVARL